MACNGARTGRRSRKSGIESLRGEDFQGGESVVVVAAGVYPYHHRLSLRVGDRCWGDKALWVCVGSGAVAAAATGCCTTALLTERLLRAVDDGVHRPSPPDTRPVGVWVAAPLVSPWSERMDASSAVASRRS